MGGNTRDGSTPFSRITEDGPAIRSIDRIAGPSSLARPPPARAPSRETPRASPSGGCGLRPGDVEERAEVDDHVEGTVVEGHSADIGDA